MTSPEWLAAIWRDPRVTDACVNGAQGIFVDRGRGLEKWVEGRSPEDEELRAWVLDQLTRAGKSWDARHPFVDATVAGGLRLHVAFPPIARNGLLVSLRRLPRSAFSEREPALAAARERWRDSPLFPRLAEAVARGDSVLIAGATGSGKTTLAADLLTGAPENDRIIALEDTPELAPPHPHFLSLVTRPPNADGCGEVTLRTLLRQTLRMRPDRVILGECRGPEVLDLLQALNTGHRGALATLHANSPRDALRRIELLCLLAGQGSIPLGAIRELLAVGVQWIAHVSRHDGRRTIRELCRVEGREGDTILLRPVIETH